MKKLILLLFITITNISLSQNVINERYSFGYDYCVFSNVLNIDSGIYINGLFTNSPNAINDKYTLLKLIVNSGLDTLKVNSIDTVGVSSWVNNMILTLDNNLAQLIYSKTISNNETFIFIKQDIQGNILVSNLLDTINAIEIQNGGIRGLWPGHLLQLQDSTYLCTANVQNLDWQTTYVKGVPMLIKLDKNGNYLWHKTYWDFITPYYNTSKAKDFIQCNDSTFVICSGVGHFDNFNNQNTKSIPKWLFVDSLGHVVNTVFFNDNINQNTSSYSFLKTNDGGFIYAGSSRKYLPNNTYWFYPQITKIDANFNQEWRIKIDSSIGLAIATYNQLLASNDTEFVAVGYGSIIDPDSNSCGMLTKFNINGDLLWQRKYVKIPVENYAWPIQELYDIDITPDSGFVMVGQAVNYNPNLAPYGQMGWVVKTDKHGCLVPNCQQYDNLDTTQTPPTDTTTTDTTLTQPPTPTDSTVIEVVGPAELYPNPATTELFYYHTQGESTNPFTCYIYNIQGQIIQQFTVSADKVTYIIDVSQLASGTYIFKVVNDVGEVVKSSKFVKV
jgi:hypothetical protein